MRTVRYSIIAAAVPVILLLTQCKDKETAPEEFKKEGIMTNLADNYIIPGYADLQLKTNTLSDSWEVFAATPSQANLDAVRNDWKAAAISFQKVKPFEVGPAMTIGLNAALGTFPADTAQIEANVISGSYNLATVDNVDAIGFESLDFLFYGIDALNKLTLSAQRREYVSDVIAKMQTEVNTVVSQWAGGYRATFVAGTGTASTSAFSVLLNAFCKVYELAKAAKLGIPIGTQSLGIQQPLYLEVRRSGFGKTLLETNINALHDIFLGRSLTGVNGQGYDDYLVALEKSGLSTTIDTRFTYMDGHPSTWNGSIEDMMGASPTTLTDFYNYMQASVVYMKTDMASAFGVLITYQDGDGD
jgi:uncharacterized protein